MEACRRQVQEGVHFGAEEDLRINSITQESIKLCWDAMHEHAFRTAGSSAANDGARMQRIWRDMSMVRGHLYSVVNDWVARGITIERLGIDVEGQSPHNVDASARAREPPASARAR